MLTKDLIKFRRDKSKIYPEYIKKKDFEEKDLIEIAREFISFFKVGVSRKEIKKFIEDISFKYFKYLRYINCFNKILSDEAHFSKDSFSTDRMNFILKAQTIRNSYCGNNKEKLEGLVEKDHLVVEDKDKVDDLDYDRYIDLVMEGTENRVDIYKDHPDYSYIEEICYLEPRDLLGLYNTRVMEWFFKSWEVIRIKVKIGKKDRKDILEFFKEAKVEVIDLKENDDRDEREDTGRKTRKKDKLEIEEFLINKKDSKVGVERIIQCLFYVLEKDYRGSVEVELDSKGIVGGKSLYRYFYMKLDGSIPFKYYNFKRIMEGFEDVDESKDIESRDNRMEV